MKLKTKNSLKAKKIFLCAAVSLFALIFTSCYEPSPLYGTWADNDGNRIAFINDGTFSARIYDVSDIEKENLINYSGDYTVIDNVIVFSITSPESFQINTEWDVRGAMLYLTWHGTDEQNHKLTLYHTAR